MNNHEPMHFVDVLTSFSANDLDNLINHNLNDIYDADHILVDIKYSTSCMPENSFLYSALIIYKENT